MSVRKAEITRPVEQVIGISCDNCNGDIPLVFPDHGGVQGTNMLHVLLTGGYGEFMDGRAHVHLCRDCAVRLFDAFPILQKKADEADI